jgi:hypothetical protein
VIVDKRIDYARHSKYWSAGFGTMYITTNNVIYIPTYRSFYAKSNSIFIFNLTEIEKIEINKDSENYYDFFIYEGKAKVNFFFYKDDFDDYVALIKKLDVKHEIILNTNK